MIHDQARLQQIANLAGEICIVTPKKRNRHSQYAYVPWHLIECLRGAVTAAGVDLDAARKRMNQILADERDARHG